MARAEAAVGGCAGTAAPQPAAQVRVELVHAAAPHAVQCLALQLPAGATVGDALRASGLAERLGAAVFAGLTPGVWGRACSLDQTLRPDDRIELYRPLLVDPKSARRLRYRRDQADAAAAAARPTTDAPGKGRPGYSHKPRKPREPGSAARSGRPTARDAADGG